MAQSRGTTSSKRSHCSQIVIIITNRHLSAKLGSILTSETTTYRAWTTHQGVHPVSSTSRSQRQQPALTPTSAGTQQEEAIETRGSSLIRVNKMAANTTTDMKVMAMWSTFLARTLMTIRYSSTRQSRMTNWCRCRHRVSTSTGRKWQGCKRACIIRVEQ